MPGPRRPSGDHLQQALAALSRAAAERVAKHPLGHLADGRGGLLELTLQVPLPAAGGIPAEAVELAHANLKSELESLLAHRAAFQPGRVFCLRCSAADCEHSAPESSRQVFAGYGPTGIPAFQDFGQWLLERQHPEIDRLYRRPPLLVTDLASGVDLDAQLLGAFRDRRLDYRIHGQVAAGWFPVPAADGKPDVLALTFQVISSAHGGRRKRPGRRVESGHRRLGLNILGAGPAGEPLADLTGRLGSIPWAGAVRWGQQALGSIERFQGRKSATPERLSGRVEGVLNGIARRLGQQRRARDRRTGHAQKRHTEGDRPTRMAVEDLARAGAESLFYDTRYDTLIVLGEKGRVHVFNGEGKLVTSIRYPPDSIGRKKKQGRWRPATAEEIAALRAEVG